MLCLGGLGSGLFLACMRAVCVCVLTERGEVDARWIRRVDEERFCLAADG